MKRILGGYSEGAVSEWVPLVSPSDLLPRSKPSPVDVVYTDGRTVASGLVDSLGRGVPSVTRTQRDEIRENMESFFQRSLEMAGNWTPPALIVDAKGYAQLKADLDEYNQQTDMRWDFAEIRSGRWLDRSNYFELLDVEHKASARPERPRRGITPGRVAWLRYRGQVRRNKRGR